VNKIRHIDYYPDEYIVGVGSNMTAEQQGVYWMICSLIYSHGGEVENDPKRIGRLVCLGQSKTRRIINELISKRKIIENQSKLSQKRSETELKKARKRIETATRNGLVPKKNNTLPEAGAFSPASLTTNHQPPTINHQPYQEAFDLWNETAKECGFPIARKIDDRKTKIIARLEDNGLDGWKEALKIVKKSSYLRGEKNGFTTTIDFMLRKSSFQKIIEGNYTDRKKGSPQW